MHKESTEFTRRVPSLQGEYRVYKESTEFTRRVPNVQGEYRMYKESTERDHASAPTLAPHSNFPAKARTLLHPICSSLPTPSPLRSSPAQTDLPRPQHFPYPPPYLLIHDHTPPTPLFPPPQRSSSSSAFPLPSIQIARPRPPLPPPFPRPTKNEAGHS